MNTSGMLTRWPGFETRRGSLSAVRWFAARGSRFAVRGSLFAVRWFDRWMNVFDAETAGMQTQQGTLRNRVCCAIVVACRLPWPTRSRRCAPTSARSARLADLLGVNRSQVLRWLRGAGIDPLNAEKVDLLELVWSSLLRLYDRDAALSWLFGVNPTLGDRRPST